MAERLKRTPGPSRAFPLVPREAWRLLLPVIAACAVALYLEWLIVLVVLIAAGGAVFFFFLDPARAVPPRARAIVSPVDGTVVAILPTDKAAITGEALKVTLKVALFGAYSARAPVEGKVLNLRENLAAGSRLTGDSGLWVRTGENEDVVVLMRTRGRFGKPTAFVGYGDRIGQGQRFAYRRLTRRVNLFIPLTARLEVEVGDRVRAGSGVIGEFVRRKPAR